MLSMLPIHDKRSQRQLGTMGIGALLLFFLLQQWTRSLGAQQVVLLTGGLGFIGSHVVEELLRRGYAVVIYDNEATGHNHNSATREIIADVRHVSELAQVGRCDYIVHLAAAISVAESMKDPEKYTQNNIVGSQNVIDFGVGAGVKHMVAASSAAVYGNPEASKLPISETEPYAGLSPYAESKYKMEELMQLAWMDQNLPCTALRFFNVFGPRQDPKSEYTGVISVFLDRANNQREIIINGDGSNTRDFVYVGDIARAIVTAMESEGGFDVFNICTGHETTLEELATMIKGLFQSSSKISHGPPREGDIAKSVCNPHKAKLKLGFTAAVDVRQGLELTAEWFRAEARAAAAD